MTANDGTSALVIPDDAMISNTAISIVPRASETPMDAVMRILATYKAINTLIELTFVDGIDYDYPAGTKKEDIEKGRATKNLLLPGMEKTRTLLGLREEYRDIRTVRDDEVPFYFYEVECVMFSIASGLEVGRGQGVCHTREKSFIRQDTRTCPKCGKTTIFKSKNEGEGWYCWRKKDGCGATFAPNDPDITSQPEGSSVDPQLVRDSVNRCRKIANKRALGDVIKKIGMMSGRFTVDMEDMDTYNMTEARPVSQVVEAPKAAPVITVTPPAPQLVTNPGQHWSKDPVKVQWLIDDTVKKGHLPKGATEKDLTNWLDREDLLDFPTCKEHAVAAVDAKAKEKANERAATLQALKESDIGMFEDLIDAADAPTVDPVVAEAAAQISADQAKKSLAHQPGPIVTSDKKPAMNGPKKSPFAPEPKVTDAVPPPF